MRVLRLYDIAAVNRCFPAAGRATTTDTRDDVLAFGYHHRSEVNHPSQWATFWKAREEKSVALRLWSIQQLGVASRGFTKISCIQIKQFPLCFSCPPRLSLGVRRQGLLSCPQSVTCLIFAANSKIAAPTWRPSTGLSAFNATIVRPEFSSPRFPRDVPLWRFPTSQAPSRELRRVEGQYRRRRAG